MYPCSHVLMFLRMNSCTHKPVIKIEISYDNHLLKSIISSMEPIVHNKNREFNIKYFLKNQTVEYLEKFDLRDPLYDLCHVITKINFPCMKYLIDSHLDEKYELNTPLYMCKNRADPIATFFERIFSECSEEIVMYLLNTCVEKNFIEVLIRKGIYDVRPIHLVILTENKRAIVRMLDIYDEYGLDLECVTSSGHSPLSLICSRGIPSLIKYIIDIHVKKGFSLRYEQENMPLEIRMCILSNSLMVSETMSMYLKSAECTVYHAF